MAAIGNFCFYLADLKKSSSLKPLEKIFLEINQSETRIVCGGHV
jgi:hypothetical protein